MDTDFKTFLNERIHEKGISLQKLSELTNIAPAHLENLTEGKYNELPPAPYLHGYIEKMAPLLGFDADHGWEMLKRERNIKIAGISDSLPMNRFASVFPIKIAAAVFAGFLIIVFVALRLPQILGVPEITVTNPAETFSVANISEFTITGKVQNGDSLVINNDNVPINPDGTWTQTVALQPGQNNFEIKASKLLGRSVTLVRQIMYQVPQPTSTSNSSPAVPAASSSVNTTSPFSTTGTRR